MNNIDERVVKMEFNNEGFSKKVSQTIKDLENLDKRMQFNHSASMNVMDNIKKTLDNFDFDKVEAGVDLLTKRFSVLGRIGTEMINRLVNEFVDGVQKVATLTKSMSIDQIGAGWQKFGDKTTSVATLIGQGYEIKEINQQLDKLNWFTDETSYNFVEMVKSIGKFTATGQELPDSVEAMMGIANWAAKAGQNAQTASNAMYQISQAMGAGFIRKEDYKSIQNASMDTREFREEAIKAALELKKLKKTADGTYKSLVGTGKDHAFTIDQFAEELTAGQWLDKDVMMKVFQKYSSAVDQIYEAVQNGKYDTASEAMRDMGGELDKFGLEAFKAAQQARTWADVVDSVKDAVSTNWMNTFELIFGNAEEATELFTNMANSLWEVFAAPGAERNEILKEWKALGGRNALWEGLGNIWKILYGGWDDEKNEEIIGFFTAIKSTLSRAETYAYPTARTLVDLTNKFRDFTKQLAVPEETIWRIAYWVSGATKPVKWIFQTVGRLLPKAISNLKILAPVGESIYYLIDRLENKIGWLDNFIVDDLVKGISMLARPLGWVLQALANAFPKINEDSFKGAMPFIEYFLNRFQKIYNYIDGISQLKANVYVVRLTHLFANFVDLAGSLFGGVKQALPSILDDLGAGLLPALSAIAKTIVGISELVRNIVKGKYLNLFGEAVPLSDRFSAILTGMIKPLKWLGLATARLVNALLPFVSDVGGPVHKFITFMIESLGRMGDKLNQMDPIVTEFINKWITAKNIRLLINKIKMGFEDLCETIGKLRGYAEQAFNYLSGKFDEITKKLKELDKQYGVTDFFKSIGSTISGGIAKAWGYLQKIDFGKLFSSIPSNAESLWTTVSGLFSKIDIHNLNLGTISEFFRAKFEEIRKAAEEKFGQVRATIEERFGPAITDAKDRVINFLTSLKDRAWTEGLEMVEKLRSKFEKLRVHIEEARNKLEGLGNSLKNSKVYKFFEDLFNKIKVFAENSPIIRGIAEAISTIITKLKELFENVKHLDVFETFSKIWGDFITSIQNLDVKNPGEFFSGLAEAVGRVIDSLSKISSDTFEQAKQAIHGFFESVATAFGETTAFGTTLAGTVKEIVGEGLNGITWAVQNFSWDKVIDAAKTALGLAMLKKAFDIFVNVGDGIKTGKTIFDKLKIMLDGLNRAFTMTNFELIADSALKLGKAAILIAFAISIIAEIPTEGIEQAVGALGSILLIIALLMFISSKLQRAAADKSVADAAKAKSEEVKNAGEAMRKGFESFGKNLKEGLVTALTNIGKAFSKGFNRMGLALLIGSITFLLLSVFGIMKIIIDGKITATEASPALGIMLQVMLLISGFLLLVAQITKSITTKTDWGWVATIIAMIFMLRSVCKLVLAFAQQDDPVAVWNAIAQISVIVIAMAFLISMTSEFKADGSGLAKFALGFAVSMEILVHVIERITKIEGDINSALGVMFALMTFIGIMAIVLGAISNWSQNSNFAGFAAFAIGFAVAILILTGALTMLAKSAEESSKIGTVIFMFTIIVAALAAVVFMASKLAAATDKLYGMIIMAGVFVAIAASVYILAAALSLLANSAPAIAANFWVIVGAIAGFLAVIAVIGLIGNSPLATGLASVAIAMLILAAALLVGAAALWLVANAFPAFVKSIDEGAESFMTIGDKLSMIFATIIYALVKGVMDAITALAAAFFAGLDTFSVAMMDSAVPLVEHVVELLIKLVWGFVKGIIKGVAKLVVDVVDWWNTTAWPWIKNGFKSPEEAVEEMGDKTVAAAERKSGEMKKSLTGIFDDTGLPEKAGQVGDESGDAYVESFNRHIPHGHKSGEELKDAAIEGMHDEEGRAAQEGESQATDFYGGMKEKALGELGGLAEQFGVSGEVGGVAFGGGMFEGAAGQMAGIPDLATEVFGVDVPTAISGIDGGIVTADYFQGMLQGGQETGDQMVDNMETSIDETTDVVAQAPIDTATDTMMNNMNRSLSGGINDAKQTASQGASEIASSFGSKGGEFEASGQSMVDGVIRGIDARVPALMMHVASLASQAQQAFNQAANINSPAKIMIPSGSAIVEGIMVGVSNMAGALYRLVASLAGGVEDSTNGFGSIGNTIDLGIDENPVITPVLDLTFVEEQAKQMDQLLSGTKTKQTFATASSLFRATQNKPTSEANQNGVAGSVTNNNTTFIQNNNSPKTLRARDIYRQTKNLIATQKEARA